MSRKITKVLKTLPKRANSSLEHSSNYKGYSEYPLKTQFCKTTNLKIIKSAKESENIRKKTPKIS